MKSKERDLAITLRGKGFSLSEISERLNVSKGSVSRWVRGVKLTEIQRERLHRKNSGGKEGSLAVKKVALEKREEYQKIGRERAFSEDERYRLCCALYWGEGDKSRSDVAVSNTEPELLKWFVDFLRDYFKIENERIKIRVMAHTDNGLTEDEINRFWADYLELPMSSIGGFTDKGKYYSSDNFKKRCHPYGCCQARVTSVEVSQQIFGSIQEIFGFNKDEWLS